MLLDKQSMKMLDSVVERFDPGKDAWLASKRLPWIDDQTWGAFIASHRWELASSVGAALLAQSIAARCGDVDPETSRRRFTDLCDALFEVSPYGEPDPGVIFLTDLGYDADTESEIEDRLVESRRDAVASVRMVGQ